MIKLVKENEDNGVDNGVDTCEKCIWYEEGDSSIGLNEGCTHTILYDDNGDIIEELENAIIECLANPRYCCLMEKKLKYVGD